MLLFYAAHKNHAVDALEQVLAIRLPPHNMLYCNSLDMLEKRLRRPRHNLSLVLLSIGDAIEMARLTELRPLLLDLRLLLVLPKRDDDTVAWAHQLAPRFIAYADNGIGSITAVLDKNDRQQQSQCVAFRSEAQAAGPFIRFRLCRNIDRKSTAVPSPRAGVAQDGAAQGAS